MNVSHGNAHKSVARASISGASAPHLRSLRVRRLAASLALVLAVPIGVVATAATAELPAHPAGAKGAHEAPRPHIPVPVTWIVRNCDDDGTDSLRHVISVDAHTGDTVDLSQLPTLCGMTDSTITLSSGQIIATQDSLTLLGPDAGSVTISAGNASRVLLHQGAGLLKIYSLTIADGRYHIVANAYGGCIQSNGAVELQHSDVNHCAVVSDQGDAAGGAISAGGDVTLFSSHISTNQATAPTQGAFGGGIFTSGTLSAVYSSISANAATGGAATGGLGGGAETSGGVIVVASTIDGNTASIGAGVFTLGPGVLQDATISGNTSSSCCALLGYGGYLTINNSTIAFNTQAGTNFGAVSFSGPSANSSVNLQSSIIAMNTVGPGNVPQDLFIAPGQGQLAASGADNLVIATNILVPPPGVITITTDPKLDPNLQFNGGRTKTHALLRSSPALGTGNDTTGLLYDQRGVGYPRTTGPTAKSDIGAFEFDSIFADALGD